MRELTVEQIAVLLKKTHSDIDKSAISFDNIICTNCGYDGLVNVGDDSCPDCKEECLKWKEEQPQEVLM